MDWINKLPSVESPAWSGLPANVERILKEQNTQRMISKVWEIQDSTEEEITLDVQIDDGKKTNKKRESVTQVAWLRVLGERCAKYLDILPHKIDLPPRTSSSITDPLFRFLERECTVASSLLDKVRSNLFDLKSMCEGKFICFILSELFFFYI